jgi:hypothetical protein
LSCDLARIIFFDIVIPIRGRQDPNGATGMRITAILALSVSMLVMACSRPGTATPRGAGPPEQEASRILGLARDLEKGGQMKKAFAAYHLIVRKFPETPAGKEAAEHIREAQRKPVSRRR